MKEKKLLQQNINKYDDNIIQKYIIYVNQLNEIRDIEKNVDIINQINFLLNFLHENAYIDENYKLNKSSKIITEINECNPFLLFKLLDHENFKNLVFSEIIALCSIFINEHKISTDIYITDLDCSQNCKIILKYLNDYKEDAISKETKINNILPYPYYLDWTINLTMFNIIKLWAENNDWLHIISLYFQENQSTDITIFQGNFIKTVLRLTNLIKNIETIVNVFNNIELIIDSFNNFNKLIIRGVVVLRAAKVQFICIVEKVFRKLF